MKNGIHHDSLIASVTPACFLATLVMVLIPHVLQAQLPSELDLLIFDPVLLDPESGREISPMNLPLQLLPLNQNSAEEEGQPEASPHTEAEELSALEITRNIESYKEAVSNIEADNGPFSPELFQTLVDMASQYQLAGEHETAIETLERAEHISRVNHGLYHPEQYASIERMIDSYLAMGDFISANQKLRYLVFLNEQHFGEHNPNTLPSLITLAESNMENFNRAITSDEPVVSFNGGVGPFGGRRQPTSQEMAFSNLYIAQQNYIQAISTMIENKRFFDPLLLNLEYNFIETLLLQSFRSAIMQDSDYYLSNRDTSTGSLIKHDFYRRSSNGYTHGKNAFERILIYLRNNPEARVYQLINALMEYGDWDMLFGRTQQAKVRYKEAYDLVVSRLELEKEYVDEFFRPQKPVHLPLITAKPNSREKFGIAQDAELEYKGYIDMTFTISRYGRAKRFDVIGRVGNPGTDIERRLIRYLRNSPFRPYFSEDEKFEAREVTLRYYFTFADRII